VPPHQQQPPSREAEVAALGRALAVERRARYIDFRGKRSTFSQFMRQTAARLCRRFPMDGRWSTIRGLYTQYANLDVASRISIIRRTEQLLFPQGTAAGSADCSAAAAESDLIIQTPSGRAAATTAPQNSGVSPHKSVNAGRPSPAVEPGSYAASPRQSSGAARPVVTGGSHSKTPPASPAYEIARSGDKPGSKLTPTGSVHERAGEIQAKPPVESQSAGEKNLHGGISPSHTMGTGPAAEGESGKSNAGKDNSKIIKLMQDPASLDVKYVKGVGPKNAELLQRLGVNTALDLIRHYPRHHLDFQNRLLIRDLRPGQEVTVFGTIRSVGAFQSKKGNVSIMNVVIGDGTGSVSISRFIGGRSNKYLLERYKAQYPKGAQVLASGIVERDRFTSRLQLKNAEVEILTELGDAQEEVASLHTNRLVPVYPLTEGLGLRYLRSIIHNALEAFEDALIDALPESIRLQNNLIGLKEALWGIHFPDDVETKDEARHRLVFDELFQIQVQLAYRRYQQSNVDSALQFAVSSGGLIEKFRESLPFTLTGAQERVFGEIARDLASTKPMHRLVQGDVGSGKTVVAALSALVAIENGFQVAVMAPTEILAEQHYRQFQKWLTPLGLRCALFLGKQGVKERRVVQQALLAGQVHVALGTHALIQDEVEFSRLGLIVIDEQHRFGVKQRAKLKAKGYNPELLTMTATPIPRTLALTVHGDLDVSEIDELPPGRKPIATKVFAPTDKAHIHGFIKEELKKGRQAYIVFPLIEESESLSAKAATAEYEKLRTTVFAEPEYKIGLMHGKLKPAQKDEIMDKFRNGEFQILVCTTVIEVGVDVPNASVMVIENADRFGLAQLHQLRGRVGRGSDQSFCFLVAHANSETTRQRLEIMEKTNDGFIVAEKDLELRGPGEFLGTRQSGMPDLFLADLVHDTTILEQSRKAAIELIKTDPELEKHPLLRSMLKSKMAQSAELVQSG
jgi:ATP-dependent DNA helicase RecG